MKRRTKKVRINELKELAKSTGTMWSRAAIENLIDMAFKIGKGETLVSELKK